MERLGAYRQKRDFSRTPEPSAPGQSSRLALRYSIQNHRATRLHWDLRLEWQGVLLSWAITRGPSLDPAEKRLAVRTEDHPLPYLGFEGEIPAGNYGAGTVMLWDIGWWQPLDPVGRGLDKGHLHFRLHGRRLTGDWNLVRMQGRGARDGKRENWLLIKADDEAAGQRDPVARYRRSVATGRSFAGIARGDAAAVSGRSGALPRSVAPQLATLVEDLADPAAFWHELKLDGYRAQVALGRDGPRVYTRSGLDWTDRFADLLPAFADLPCDSALLDGEIVAGAGLQGFGALQDAITAGGPFRYVAFDLLSLDGRDRRDQPLASRRKALERLCRSLVPMGAVTLSPLIEGEAGEFLAMVCAGGGEGLIAKRRDAPYRAGRSRDWMKIKCRRRGEFVIIGWQASPARGRAFASLALAAHQDGALRYMGKVGTGFDADSMARLQALMRGRRRGSPAAPVPPAEAAGVTWIRPDLVAEVDFAEITGQGRLRHAVFLGLREDKPATEVEAEMAEDGSERIAGIAVSSGGRRIFDQPPLTKAEIARYYAKIAPAMLEEASDRPLSLLRLPEGMAGERFFQKHPGKGFPPALKVIEIAESDGAPQPYAYVANASGLVGAVQMGTVEFHIWGARRDRLDRPDRLVFDLDPDEALGFAEVRQAALDLRALLGDLGLACWAMVSGGKGVHLVVPLRRTVGWDSVKLFSQGVATLLAQTQPERFVASMSKARRHGRIFVDWLRNERGATAIAPFSIRARPGAPVACPVAWQELPDLPRAAGFSTADALARRWQGIDRPPPQILSAQVVAALEDRLGASGAKA